MRVALCCCAAWSVALWLHGIEERPWAAVVVLVTVPWGVLAATSTRAFDLRTLLLLAAAVRLVQVGAPPTLSDDLYRYLFEGRALLEGANPFLHAPATLAALDPELAAQVNHAEIPSIYPPTAQLWFRMLAAVGSAAWIAQLGMALVDLGNVALLRKLAPSWAATVYALHPVPVLEAAHGAHLESLGILFCLATVATLESGRAGAGIWAMFGAGVKILPLLFVPSILRQRGHRGLLVGTSVVVGLALPVLAAGPALIDALGTYTSTWSFNGLLHPFLESTLGSASRPALALAGLGVAGWAATLEPRRAWLMVGTGFLCLSPTVHPWYTLWALVPALLLGRRDWAIAATFLQGSYLVIATLHHGAWAPPTWLGLVTWGPALVALYVFREPSPTAP